METQSNKGGIDKYFADLEEYERSLSCDECGNEELQFSRTTSNCEVHFCHNCKTEKVTPKMPNEDKY